MTDTAWRGANALGTVRAGDLISALTRVSSARSRHEQSPLSGVTLFFSGATLTVWASDQARLAVMPVTLANGVEAPHLAVVPGGYAAEIKAAFERREDLELALRDGRTLLARRPGSDTVLAQPLWLPEPQTAAYGAFTSTGASGGFVVARGKEVASRLAGLPERNPVSLVVGAGQLWLHSDGSTQDSPIGASGSLPPQTIVLNRGLLADAVDAVTNVKLPNVMIEVVGDDVVRLIGTSRSEPVEFGALHCLVRTGPVPDHDVHPVLGGDAGAPVAATTETPTEASPVDEILAELDGIIGQPVLKKQVRSLINQVEINRMRAERGLKVSQVGSHMVFAGPPGTGKTTVARLIAKLLHALGALERPKVKEVARPDLVSQNIGGTEEKTMEAIEDALGGVLFVDEAYTLASGGETDFGKQAIDTLLKEVEDKRDAFVCILAGYTHQMKTFMASNPGLPSRFPRTIDFEQYSVEELVQIAKSMAKGMDNDISDDGVTELTQRLTDEQRRGGFERKDWGNARSIRNIVEQASTHRDMRISMSGAHDYESLVMLTAADVAEACNDFAIGRAAGKSESVEDVLAELDAQVGQPQLKSQVRAIVAQAKVQQIKQAQGLTSEGMALEHLLFTGPPGTGKTTVARLIARLYRALGVLPQGEIVEVSQSNLVAGYKGQTAIQTRDKIDEAMGGVLFIDEAYTLVSGGDSSFGQEAIDELLPRLENDRGKFVAIAAGYPDEMESFVASNVGLRSRFTTTINFLPYTAEELVQIAVSMASGKAEKLTEGAVEVLRAGLRGVERAGGFADKAWGNARAVRNLLQRAVQLRDLRVSDEDLTADPTSLVTITETDMEVACAREGLASGGATEDVADVLAELDEQVGQRGVKYQVRSLVAQAQLAQERKDAGLAEGPVLIEHLLFVGPPGTGKTTMARLIGRLYKALGLLPKGHMVQVDRSGLVAEYVGQTAPKTNKKISEAMGGILFIDEAYALVPTNESDFGGEAINTLVPRLTDDKNKFLAIAAGYPEDMRRFLTANVGLKSRFTTQIEFQPYDARELVLITQVMARKRGQQFGDGALDALQERLDAAASTGRFVDSEWGNAREMGNLLDDAMKRRDLRLHSEGYQNPEEMVTLALVDVVGACEKVLAEA